jgi:predicted amidohydrolase
VQALKGADFLVNISASAAGFEEFWDHALFMRAAENSTWYMVCSVVGMQRGDRLFGGSRVVAPSGKVVAAGRLDEEDVVVAEIDLGQMRSARATGHTFSVRNPALYAAVTDPPPYP